jgi:hypothetical protein
MPVAKILHSTAGQLSTHAAIALGANIDDNCNAVLQDHNARYTLNLLPDPAQHSSWVGMGEAQRE